ncbi:MAG: ATP-grasp domain-containing protein [Pirellulaceae bacterium]|nr:ATP-grasp domain-containing protein [Pirellulaceae bacterium]
MKRLRVLVLMDEDLVPPDSVEGYSEEEQLEWQTEFDVLTTLKNMGHDAQALGVSDDLGVIRKKLLEMKPHITFNLLEEFHGLAIFDQHVASYLELMKQPYTGCNPRGLMLAHDKAISKQILSYHRIPTPLFAVYPRGKVARPPRRKQVYPLLVKSVIEEASLGITKDSIVHTEKQLIDRIAYIHEEICTDALVEEFIEGRELYVGLLGNQRLQTFPIWEMTFGNLPDNIPKIATRRVKWDLKYQKEIGLKTHAATDLPPGAAKKISRLCRRVYRVLFQSGYSRMDLRMTEDGKVYVLEANPNPNLSFGEDFAESAEKDQLSYPQLLQRILNLGLRYHPGWRG